MRKRSKLWNMEQELKELSVSCSSINEMLIELGYTRSPGNYDTLKKIAREFNITLPLNMNKYKNAVAKVTIPLEDILIENSNFIGGQRIKKKLIAAGLKEDKCEVCGINSNWNGLPLVLQLDHINGINYDNRLENLRIICPNCHSQTKTFAGGNAKRLSSSCA